MKPRYQTFALSALAATFCMPTHAALEEVIVTAQKREQSIQDIPISIVALSAQQIEQRGIRSIGDIAGTVPNVKITPTPTNTTATTIAIRGSVTHNPAIYWEPTVGIYIDGVYVAKNTGANFDVADIKRIEVLRGPQGTLYGKNTIGGAVNFITEAPSGNLEGEVRLGVGDYNLRSAYGSLNLPAIALGVGDLKTKLVASSRTRDGLYDNHPDPYGNALAQPVTRSKLNDLDRQAYRFDALLDSDDRYSLRYVFDYSEIKQNPAKGQLTHVDLMDFSFGPLPPSFADYLTPDSKNRSSTSLNRATREETSNRSHSLFVNYDLTDTVSLRYIGNYRDMTATDEMDIDGSPLDIFGSAKYIDYEQFSHELQFSGHTDTTQWLVGLYYFKEKTDAEQPIDFFPFLYDDPILGAFYGPQNNRFGFNNDSVAIFGQVEWVPAAQWLDNRLTLTLGSRWTQEEKDAYLDSGAGAFYEKDNKRYQNFSPTLAASWTLSEASSVYAKVAQGWKSGGFNGEVPTATAFHNPYDEETVRSMELGLKSMLLDGRLRFNAAVFHNVIEDMQHSIFISGGGALSNVENAGEANISGLELEVHANLTDQLQLGISYGYLDAEYKEFIDTDPITGLRRDFSSEKDFPYTPRHSAGAFIEYTFTGWGWGELIGHLDYQYMDNYVPYVNPEQNQTSQIDSYQLLNGRLTLGNLSLGNSGTLELALWGKNLLGEEYRVNTIPFGPWTVSYFGDPRTYGLDLKYRF